MACAQPRGYLRPMKLTIFYHQPKQRPDSMPAVEPVSGDFVDVAEATRIAMASVASTHTHCDAFEIRDTAGSLVAAWKRPDA